MLLRRIWAGDSRARDQLVRAYLPVVKRIAHARLPGWARGVGDTDDVVSITMEKALGNIESFQPRREGAFLAYLRTILTNEINTYIRRARVRPIGGELDAQLPSKEPSPLERLLGRELHDRYESALERMTPEQREAIVLRIEMGFSHREIAEKLDLPSADAARMVIARAMVRLERELRDDTAGDV